MTTIQASASGSSDAMPQPPPSPIPTNNSQGASLPSPQSETSVRNPTLTDNDLLGLSIDPRDDDTAPSSSDDTATPVYTVEGTIADEEEDDIYGDGAVRPLIYGYLRKLGRNGKWQKRFFETDGESLSYYRSEKRSVPLAALDLRKVGTICLSAEDPCTFFIQVADRPYSLRAESRQTCIDWVITLNRVKEARLQVGGVKLVTPRFQDDATAPRVVLKANRPRTRAVDDQQQWREMTSSQVAAASGGPQPSTIAYETLQLGVSQHLTQWRKPRNTYYRVKHKMIKWARSIKKMAISCSNPTTDSVILDTHLHPPGHDNSDKHRGMAEEKVEDLPPRYLD